MQNKVKLEQCLVVTSVKGVTFFKTSLNKKREEAGAQPSITDNKCSTSHGSKDSQVGGHCIVKWCINLEITIWNFVMMMRLK